MYREERLANDFETFVISRLYGYLWLNDMKLQNAINQNALVFVYLSLNSLVALLGFGPTALIDVSHT